MADLTPAPASADRRRLKGDDFLNGHALVRGLAHIWRHLLQCLAVVQRPVLIDVGNWNVADNFHAQLVDREVFVLRLVHPLLSGEAVALVVFDQLREQDWELRCCWCASASSAVDRGERCGYHFRRVVCLSLEPYSFSGRRRRVELQLHDEADVEATKV